MAKKMARSNKFYYVLIVLLMVVSLVISFKTPVNAAAIEKYHLSAVQLRMLGLSLSLPLFAIWVIAVYGFAKTRSYAHKIKADADADARGFADLSAGLGILAFSLPISSIVSGLMSYFSAKDLGIIPTAVTINQWVSVILALAAYYKLCQGARELAKTVKTKLRSPGQGYQPVAFGIAGGAYAYFIVSHAVRRVAPTATTRATYYLPDWAILVTILTPLVVAWYLGLMAVYYLAIYRKHVKGLVYRRALNWIGRGIAALVVLSVSVQLLGAFGAKLGNLDLAPLLAIIYFLVAGIAVCYLFIAKGARLLKKIEEV